MYQETQVFADDLKQLVRLLNAGSPETVDLASVINRAEVEFAPRNDRVFTLPKAKALQALVTGNVAEWEHAVGGIVAAHREEALKGEYKLLEDGFIALPALMLARLGMERGQNCKVESPYLPLELVI